MYDSTLTFKSSSSIYWYIYENKQKCSIVIHDGILPLIFKLEMYVFLDVRSQMYDSTLTFKSSSYIYSYISECSIVIVSRYTDVNLELEIYVCLDERSQM